MSKIIKSLIILLVTTPVLCVSPKAIADLHLIMQQATNAYATGNKTKAGQLLVEASHQAKAAGLSEEEHEEFKTYLEAMPGVCDDPGVCLQKCCFACCYNS